MARPEPRRSWAPQRRPWTASGGAGSVTLGSALLESRTGALRRLGDAAGHAAGLLGMPLSGYTAVLLSNTAVPVWQSTRRTLPHLFIGTSVSGLASLFGLLPALPPEEEKVVERFGLAGKVVDLAAMAAMEREASRVEPVGRPATPRRSLRDLWKAARGMTAASLALSLLPGKARIKKIASGLLGTAGAIALRFAVFHVGKASARDPRATFRQQRSSMNP